MVPILVVDDDGDHAELVRRTLERHDPRFAVTHVATGRACLEALAERAWAVVLLDYRLPGTSGLDVLRELRVRGVDVPVVIATAQGDERLAVEAMQAGALDYVVKASGYFTTLPTVVNKVLKQHELARENARLYREARTQSARLAQIFDATSDGILLLGPEGAVLAANRQAGTLFGLDAGALLGADFAALVGCRETGADASWTDGGEVDVTIPATGRTVHVTAQPTRDDAGALIGLTLTVRDVTREREVDRMKSEFVAFVAHQLRTPLSGMKWMLELAREEPAGSAAAGAHLRDAAESVERLIRMVNDLLNVSRLESGTIPVAAEPTDLGELTEAVVTELKPDIAAKAVTITVEGAEHVPSVRVGPKLFREAIFNLVGNAVKYTPARGTIAIRMGATDGAVWWEIRDSGIGIPRAARARLFQKFSRAENAATVDTDGAGLGLYLVKLVVERSGGRIDCESEEGRGATFRISLPSRGDEP